MRRMNVGEFRARAVERDEFEGLDTVRRIIAAVREKGDAALKQCTSKFDRVSIDSLRIERGAIEREASTVDPGIVAALEEAADGIRRFAEVQQAAYRDFEIEVRPGVIAGQRVIPIRRIGIYVPGGRYPLASSLLMGALPAKTAGVEEIAVCAPPDSKGRIPPAVLAAAQICGVDEIYRVGGAQAIAAMAYGTESIPRVDKIIGPGNAYVTAAKRLVNGDAGIDFVAGPTELMVIADRSANPSYIAADLIGQAEHDVGATAILITDSEELAGAVERRVESFLEKVGTRKVAEASLKARGAIVIVSSMDEAADLANERAPEHLELFTEDAEQRAGSLRNFGSLFVGERAAGALGDYSSGLNHILPTQGAARFTGGLGVRDFLKIQTTLKVDGKGLEAIGGTAAILARTEGLDGHALSIEVRKTG